MSCYIGRLTQRTRYHTSACFCLIHSELQADQILNVCSCGCGPWIQMKDSRNWHFTKWLQAKVCSQLIELDCAKTECTCQCSVLDSISTWCWNGLFGCVFLMSVHIEIRCLMHTHRYSHMCVCMPIKHFSVFFLVNSYFVKCKPLFTLNLSLHNLVHS